MYVILYGLEAEIDMIYILLSVNPFILTFIGSVSL
jgi:hypothetical protein